MDIGYLEFEHEVSIFGSHFYCIAVGPADGITSIVDMEDEDGGEGGIVLTNKAGETCTVDWDCVRTYSEI